MSSNNGQMDMLVSGIVVVLLVAMFTGGAYMIAEATGDSTVKAPDGKTSITVEPKKMYFGIAYLVAAALFGIIFVYTLFKSNRYNYGNGA